MFKKLKELFFRNKEKAEIRFYNEWDKKRMRLLEFVEPKIANALESIKFKEDVSDSAWTVTTYHNCIVINVRPKQNQENP